VASTVGKRRGDTNEERNDGPVGMREGKDGTWRGKRDNKTGEMGGGSLGTYY
jgi:hypothetical protein